MKFPQEYLRLTSWNVHGRKHEKPVQVKRCTEFLHIIIKVPNECSGTWVCLVKVISIRRGSIPTIYLFMLFYTNNELKLFYLRVHVQWILEGSQNDNTANRLWIWCGFIGFVYGGFHNWHINNSLCEALCSLFSAGSWEMGSKSPAQRDLVFFLSSSETSPSSLALGSFS